MSESPVEIVIDTEGLKNDLMKDFDKKFAAIQEALVAKAEPESLTESVKDPVQDFDYRVGIWELLRKPSARASMHSDEWDLERNITTINDIVVAKTTDGNTAYSLKESFVETIGTVSQSNCCIPIVWADKIERDHVYPGSIFLGAWFMNWYDEIQGKPGDSVVICSVGPATCVNLECEEPATEAADITCGTIELEHDVCAYAICKNTMEVMQTGVIDALNEGLGSCLAVCVDNYFLDLALDCGTTMTCTVPMSGSIIAEAMGSMRAGTYEPVKLIIHPVVEASLMQDSQFVHAGKFGNRDVITGGRVVQWLGLEINVTPKGTLLVGNGTYRSLLLAKGALAGALKHGITIESEYSPRLQKRWVLADIKYGGLCLHDDGILWIVTDESSPC